MADTSVSAGLTVEQWDDQFFTEYLTENRYAGEMGTNENSIIQVKENLTKKPGDRVNFALVNKLTQDAITGRNTLEGNEEDMETRSFELAVDKRRNGVRVAEIDEQFSAIVAARCRQGRAEGLVAEGHRKADRSRALASINGAAWPRGLRRRRDAWLVDNADRVLFGVAAYAGDDHSAGWRPTATHRSGHADRRPRSRR